MFCNLVLCMHNFILMGKIKSLGHAFHVNNFSVQERLTRESVYLCDCMTEAWFPSARNVNPPQILDLLWFVTV